MTGLLLSVRMRALLHKIAETPLRGRVKALNPLQKFILSRESVLNVILVTFPVEATPNTGLCFSTGQRVHVCVLPMTWEHLCMCVCVCESTWRGGLKSFSYPTGAWFFIFLLVFGSYALKQYMPHERCYWKKEKLCSKSARDRRREKAERQQTWAENTAHSKRDVNDGKKTLPPILYARPWNLLFACNISFSPNFIC